MSNDISNLLRGKIFNVNFLLKQSQKPSGLGWVESSQKYDSFYFKKLSLWAIKQTTISDNYRILEIGYGGSTIRTFLL